MEKIVDSTLLIENGLVVTMDPQRRVIETNVYVVGNRIAELTTERRHADEVIDASGQLVIPGLVQSHVHLCQALFRGMADELDVIDWLRLRIWPLEQAHDGDSVYDSARLAISEMICSGTTTALTIETVHHTERVFEAVVETGFRATVGKAMMDHFEVGTEMIGESTRTSIDESLELLGAFHGQNDGRVRYAFCPRGSRNCTEELWRTVSELAVEHDTLVHTHAAENEAQTRRLASQGGTDVEYLDRLGALSDRTVLAHSIWITDEEVMQLKQRGAHVAHCPSANLKLASGFAPIPELLEQGVNVGLGADGAACNNNLDMFHEMRLAALIHKPRAGAQRMTAAEVLEMATLGGAKALGQQDQIGSLEPGKRADIVLVRRDGGHVQPHVGGDPIGELVYAHQSSDVDTVIIDGRCLLRGGGFVELDGDEITSRARRSAARVLDDAGL